MRLTNNTEEAITIEPGETVRIRQSTDTAKGLSKRIEKIFINEVIW